MAKKSEHTEKEALPESLSFEEALSQLEDIVEKLENGELSLEDCVAQFERGTKLSEFCESKLSDTAKRIEILKKTGPQSATWAPLQEDEIPASDEAPEA